MPSLPLPGNLAEKQSRVRKLLENGNLRHLSGSWDSCNSTCSSMKIERSPQNSISLVSRWYDSGEIAHYKEGNVTTVAHSETHPDSNQRVIVCNKRTYWVNYDQSFWSWLSTIDDGQNSIGLIVQNKHLPYVRTRSNLPESISLYERVFITLLAFDWPDHQLSKVK